MKTVLVTVDDDQADNLIQFILELGCRGASVIDTHKILSFMYAAQDLVEVLGIDPGTMAEEEAGNKVEDFEPVDNHIWQVRETKVQRAWHFGMWESPHRDWFTVIEATAVMSAYGVAPGSIRGQIKHALNGGWIKKAGQHGLYSVYEMIKRLPLTKE